MPLVKVWLDDWEHGCCGPFRRVGDDATFDVYAHGERLHEQRHDYQNGQESNRHRGRLVSIEWHPAILRPLGFGHEVVGYGPGVALDTTNDRPEGRSWAFEFTIDPDAVCPDPEGSVSPQPSRGPSRTGRRHPGEQAG